MGAFDGAAEFAANSVSHGRAGCGALCVFAHPYRRWQNLDGVARDPAHCTRLGEHAVSGGAVVDAVGHDPHADDQCAASGGSSVCGGAA